ncbi:MAG: hypothetical protein NC548_39885 [Lachnospiraceae bacterium]|nr:hypothetical protein [Lachnospiraceae bacterium]
MKKKFLWMFMVAAAAMTSCSSFDEPAVMDGDGDALSRAGEPRAAGYATTEAELRTQLSGNRNPIYVSADVSLTEDLEINREVTISSVDNGKITSTASIICNANVVFQDMTIDANTPLGTGAIALGAEDITVTLDNVKLTQNAIGTEDARSKAGIAIKYEAYNNNLVIKNNTVITMPSNKYVRAIDMLPSETASVKGIEITGSTISIGTDPKFPSTYSRGVSFSNITCDNFVIDSSTLEGAYYIINVNGSSVVNANVRNNSTLSGRCGFNIWSTDFTATVDNSTIVGKNNWSGSMETFANVVINTTAERSNLTFINTTFKMDVSNEYQTNRQYAIQYRASDQTLLVKGVTTVIDTPENAVSAYVVANAGVSGIKASVEDFTFNSADANCKNFF